MRRYISLLRREISLRGLSGARPDTVYIGGGTPSILGPDGVAALFAALPVPGRGAEISFECNPGDVSPPLVEALQKVGVNRISLGVQSFCDETLRFLGRRHDARTAREAFFAFRHAAFAALSMDFIVAIPGEPAEQCLKTLSEAAAMRPDHASVYALSIEPGTALEKAGIQPPEPDCVLDSVAMADRILAEAGLERYEVSNWSLPGMECQHNSAVWRGEDYVGVGPAAFSREGLSRHENIGTFGLWAEAVEIGRLPFCEDFTVSPDEDETERFVVRTRLSRWKGPDTETAAGKRRMIILEELLAEGFVKKCENGLWSLTPRGREVADAVMERLA